MKREQFKSIVMKNKDQDENAIVLALITAGASLDDVNIMLNGVLVELGLRVDYKAALKQNPISCDELGLITNYRVLREFAEAINSENPPIQMVRSLLKKAGLPAPKKINLGSVKTSVVNYFYNNDSPNVDELIKAIMKGADMTADKAKLHASQLYQLGVLLHNNQRLVDVN